MNIRWDYFVNQYDTARYVSGDGARDNRHILFVREFASVVSILQVTLNGLRTQLERPDCEFSSGQDKQCHRLGQGYPALNRGTVNLSIHSGSIPRALGQDTSSGECVAAALMHQLAHHDYTD